MRGTSIRLELKEDCAEFSQGGNAESIVKKYSNFIPFPIRLDSRQLNTQEAIWTRSKEEVNPEEYEEFFSFHAGMKVDKLFHVHLSIDAPVQYRALVYVPDTLSDEILYSGREMGIDLYASKVRIQERNQDLLPPYLRFLRGLVDTEDLPLNVSRETVQQNPLLRRLNNSLTSRILRELKTLAEDDPALYEKFWHQYGKVLKEGYNADQASKEKLNALLRFNSSSMENQEDLVSLKQYLERMDDDQKEIFYIVGPSRAAVERNPNLEFFKKKGLEVLFMYDQIDDFMMTSLGEYEGKTFASVDQTNIEALQNDADEEKTSENALAGEELEGLLTAMKDLLGDKVTEVKASKRLVESPAVLVNPDGMSGSFQKMMKAINREFQVMPKIFEINPAHELIQRLSRIRGISEQEPVLRDLVEQLYFNCLLVEGLVEHPEEMVDRIQSIMARAAEQADSTR